MSYLPLISGAKNEKCRGYGMLSPGFAEQHLDKKITQGYHEDL